MIHYVADGEVRGVRTRWKVVQEDAGLSWRHFSVKARDHSVERKVPPKSPLYKVVVVNTSGSRQILAISEFCVIRKIAQKVSSSSSDEPEFGAFG